VVESAAGSPNPAEFFSRPDTPYPLAVVLADACALAGQPVRPLRGLDPAVLAGIAAGGSDGAGLTVLLANLTPQARDVRVTTPGQGALARARVLDEHSFASATADLPAFLASRTDLPVSEGAVTVTLHAYATARLDLSGE